MTKSLPILFAFFFACCVCFGEEARFTVRVLDEAAAAVTNADVHVGITVPMKPGWGWGGGKEDRWQGKTDTNGLCAVDVKCYGEAAVAVLKDGYYSGSGYSVMFTNLAFGKWQPWNPTKEVILKRIGQPVPMYARSVRDMTIPSEGKDLGFDLERGDWVHPDGKGEHADLLFRLDRKPEREVMRYWGKQPRPQKLYDVTLSVSLPNDGDGIQSVFVPPRGGGSNLRLPAKAPEAGYATNVIKRVYNGENKPPHSDVREDQNYFCRVHTKKDDKGNIVSALYGKIHGDFSGFDYGKLTFTYYLNPTPNDRNVEFDPNQNLFKNLSSLEEVRAP